MCCAKINPVRFFEVKNFARNFDFWLLLDDARIAVKWIYTIAFCICQKRHIQDLHFEYYLKPWSSANPSPTVCSLVYLHQYYTHIFYSCFFVCRRFVRFHLPHTFAVFRFYFFFFSDSPFGISRTLFISQFQYKVFRVYFNADIHFSKRLKLDSVLWGGVGGDRGGGSKKKILEWNIVSSCQVFSFSAIPSIWPLKHWWIFVSPFGHGFQPFFIHRRRMCCRLCRKKKP